MPPWLSTNNQPPPPPPPVHTRDHGKRPDDVHELCNPLFPGKTTLPLNGLALRCDPNGGPLSVIGQEQVTDARRVSETRFTLQLTRHRLAPEAGFQMFFLRLCHDDDERFVPTGRTVQFAWSLTNGKDAKDQTLTFPPHADVPITTSAVHLGATSSSGLPVAYFVVQGPDVIHDGDFIPMEIPLGTKRPLSVTIGAYQVGEFRPSGGTKPTPSFYQTFRLIP